MSFLLMLLSTLGFGAGVLDGLIGGLFMSSEIRALKEFEWEVRNARDEAERVERTRDEDGVAEINRQNEKQNENENEIP